MTTILVETPTRLDREQAQLIRQLAALREEEDPEVVPDSQQEPKTVFGRFKDALGGR